MVSWKLLFVYRRHVRRCVFHRSCTTILLFRWKKRFIDCFKCIVLMVLVYTFVSIHDHCHIYQSAFNDILIFFLTLLAPIQYHISSLFFTQYLIQNQVLIMDSRGYFNVGCSRFDVVLHVHFYFELLMHFLKIFFTNDLVMWLNKLCRILQFSN